MVLYQLYAIDTAKLDSLLSTPSESQLRSFANHLTENPQSNAYFSKKNPPKWKSEPVSWVAERLLADDWYADLSEPEMVAWDGAIQEALRDSEMRSTGDFTILDVDGVSACLFDFAHEAVDQSGRDARYLQLTPLRFHELPASINAVEPSERIYWPEHAVVSPTQVKQIADTFRNYKTLVDGLTPRKPQLARQLQTEGFDAAGDIPDLLTFLDQLVLANATWYAPVDC
ncbi:hypothetical protein Poly24_36290 [Rosistilla carotiformis]|uniref:Uncharacterized protein n=1 Tax=Rosistilla carotiformis TaxID=2528017 RepID=A0A518JWJ1_9BACT|nr:hypothetical protein [Rosistilla carotiformis]QDV69911.1 hypothetical protein Poly24_36290 [Rosistilla carotiformis]